MIRNFVIKSGIAFLALAAFLLAFDILPISPTAQKPRDLVFYNTLSGPPDSFDPLDLDAANNVFVGRMMYATPLEFDQTGSLVSTVLSHFSYDNKLRQIRFELQPDLTYHDGQPITIQDLALAIKRMALKRPKFPVLEKILGLEEWLNLPQPLKSAPTGMQIDGATLLITFSEALDHPLFRFTLELFAIIPESCVDLTQGHLVCQQPPGSGRYSLVNGKLGQTAWTFTRQKAFAGAEIPENVRIVFSGWEDSIQELVGTTENNPIRVAGGFGDAFLNPQIAMQIQEAGLRVVTTPKSWHMVMKLNSKEGPFLDPDNRRLFISILRREMKSRFPNGIQPEGSLFTRLLEGYVDYSKEENTQAAPAQRFRLSTPVKQELVWVGKDPVLPAVDDAIGATCSQLGISCRKIPRSQYKGEHFDLFVGMTGFWSYDPYGDLKMLFTPNLHKQLQDLAEDKTLQEMIANLVRPGFSNKGEEAKKLDRYLYGRHIYNVMTHFPFVFLYAQDGPSGSGIPQSGTLPYPWMLAR